MKKIPTLFERTYKNHKVVDCLPNVTEGMDWVLNGYGLATIKFDGACCAIINGIFYKRYDAKNNKTPPPNAIPCSEPDPITGHWPHWIPVQSDNPSDKYFVEAFNNTCHYVGALGLQLADGTYEAIGPKIQNNPYHCSDHILIKHGTFIINNLDRSYDGIKKWLEENNEEGIVFWLHGEPMCKIKRTDFGLPWPVKNNT